MKETLSRLLPSWLKFPGRYALWRMGITYKESRGYNTTDRVLLTFDDDGTSENIRGILDVLAREGVKAFFYIKGDWAEAGKPNTQLIEEMKGQGHWVGSHTYSHGRLTEMSEEKIRSEMERGLQTKYMRPPYGAYNRRVRKIIHSMDFRIAYWTVDSLDWKGISAEQIQENVLPKIHKGACVLMHLNTPHTLEALPGLINGIRKRGYELCSDGTEIAD